MSQLVFNLFLLLVSLLSLLIVALEFLNLVPAYLQSTFVFMDFVFSFIFLTEFLMRLKFSRNKLKYLRWGWIDLLSAIPLYQFKVLRVLRIIVFLRVLKSIIQLHRIRNIFHQENSLKSIVSNSFLAFILLTVLMLMISTVSILYFEHRAEPLSPTHHIKTLQNALWWSFVTITTVGYGDFYPTTIGGKITAIILMVFGIGLFSSLTVYFSSFLINRFQKEVSQKEIKRLSKEIKEIKQMLQKMNLK